MMTSHPSPPAARASFLHWRPRGTSSPRPDPAIDRVRVDPTLLLPPSRMPSSEENSDSPPKAMSGDSRDTAIRDAKRFVRDVVRNDWEFDPHTSADAARPTSSSSTESTGTLYQNRQVTEWRCREFDSSGSELEPQSSDDDDSDSPSGGRPAETAAQRRRKRRRQMDEEMTWNEGLRMWMAQRDAWSGARTRRQIRAKEQKRKLEEYRSSSQDPSTVDSVDSGIDTSAGKPPPSDQKSHSETTEGSGLANTTERSLSISEKERLEEEQSTAPDDEKRKESTETGLTEPDAHMSKDPSRLTTFPAIDDSDPEDTDEGDEPLIPVAPPFISADNPIRATIGPAIYPSIYAKVVVQGMTPTVPVNLADLTNAMVHGWKADGQWPPKPAVTSIVLQDDASVPKTASSDNPTQTRRKNSITNAMRKVFHNPFHRRGSADAASGNGTPGAV